MKKALRLQCLLLVEISARCAAGSLNPHPVLRTGVEGQDALRSQARCRLSAFLFTGILHRVSRPPLSPNSKKGTAFAVPFAGGDKGSRTPDLLNAIQALSQLSYTPKWLRCFLDNDDIISQRPLFVNRFLKSFFKKINLYVDVKTRGQIHFSLGKLVHHHPTRVAY